MVKLAMDYLRLKLLKHHDLVDRVVNGMNLIKSFKAFWYY